MMHIKPAAVVEASCDSCGKNLITIEKWHEDGDQTKPEQTSTYVENGILQGDFGYGSKFDACNTEFHLCEDCFLKAARLLGLDFLKYCPGMAGWTMECKIHPGKIYKDCCGPKRGFDLKGIEGT